MIEIIGGLVAALLASFAVIAYLRQSKKLVQAENDRLETALEKAHYTIDRMTELNKKIGVTRAETVKERLKTQEQIDQGNYTFLEDDHV